MGDIIKRLALMENNPDLAAVLDPMELPRPSQV